MKDKEQLKQEKLIRRWNDKMCKLPESKIIGNSLLADGNVNGELLLLRAKEAEKKQQKKKR